MRLGPIALLCGCAFIAPTLSRADDISDQINQALAAYQKHDLNAALSALDVATSLIRQARADAWKTFLPPVPPGWQADDAQATAAGPVLFGGGSGASRQYRKGEWRVEVTILTDSPILQGVGAMLSSVASASGGRVLVVNGRRMVYVKDDNSFTALIADKVMVKVAGSVATPEDQLRLFIAAIDFAGIDKLAR
jgi:hypothetical protein